MELLKQLYCIHSKSNEEDKMLNFLVEWLFDKLPTSTVEMDKTGNLYVTKGESSTYPCIVAHIDQVQTLHSSDFQAVETDDIIFGWSSINKRKEGLGADDKNGVWIALKCLLKYDAIKVALFVGEEIGCVGSDKADMDFFNDCRFVLQCDRRGYNDFITSACCCELCSKHFEQETNFELFGYKKSHGMMTDVMTLKENGLGVSCANISCGYYEPHTDDEFTIKSDLLNCLSLVEYIIENCTGVYLHTYTYVPYSYQYSSWYDKKRGANGYSGYGKNGNYNGKQITGFVNNSNTLATTQPVVSKQQSATTTKSEDKVIVQKHFDVDARSFVDESQEDCYFQDFENDDNSWLAGLDEETTALSEEMRDEIYDSIYALLSSCPNASFDMIYASLKNTYVSLSWDDARILFYEVTEDMKKYFTV